MSTVRVTLNTGDTHDVEITPETAVSFRTDVGTGDGRTLIDMKSWSDVADIAMVTEADAKPATKAELTEQAEGLGLEVPSSATKADIQALIDVHVAEAG